MTIEHVLEAGIISLGWTVGVVVVVWLITRAERMNGGSRR